VISNLIPDEVEQLIDPKNWRKAIARENRGRKRVDAAAATWTKVEALLRGCKGGRP
jgi:hypothetical protein